MFRYIALVLVFLILHTEGNASIFCPPDKNMLCSDDKYNLDKLGRPVLMGNSQGKQARFIDDNQLNSCQAGYIYRKWYVDSNNDQQWQSTELYCIQTLHFAYENHPFFIQFPSNKTYSCKQDIVFEKPVWVTGPCNVMGYTYKDDVFEVAEDACYKILRKFKVVDWCDSDGDGNMNIWEHTQVIKVIDEDAPKIQPCAAKEFHVGQDCKAQIILTNSALDDQACGAQLLQWTVWVDLWANGDYDLEFSNLKSGDFYLARVANGATISVTLPERVGLGNHKVYWSVRDECGNIRSCSSTFKVVDKKPPTPYLHTLLTAAFHAQSMPLMVPARLFNVGSFDNCTSAYKLKYSFSEDINDTIRIVDCSNAGFQFYTLYVTDKFGNQEFVDVYLLAFDNGSCNALSTLTASLQEGNGMTVSHADIMAIRPDMKSEAVMGGPGSYLFEQLPLYADFMIKAEIGQQNEVKGRVNVLDMVMLQEYILGKRELTQFELPAADLDMDNTIRTKDLMLLRKKILTGQSSSPDGQEYRVLFEPGQITKENMRALKSTGSIMQYDGNFDFKAVLSGDISEANSIETEVRNTTMLEVKETDQGLEIYTLEEVSIKGLQMEFRIDDHSLSIESEVLDFNVQNVYREKDGLNRILITENIHLTAGQKLFSIPGAAIRDVTLLGTNGWVTDAGVFENLAWRFADELPRDFVLYPNPMTGDEFQVQGSQKITRIMTAGGRFVPFIQSGQTVILKENVASGLLLVSIEGENGHFFVKKLTKLP